MVYDDAVHQYEQDRDSGRLLQTIEVQRAAGIEGASAKEQGVVDRLHQSLQLQEESWDLICQAIRRDDGGAARQGRKKMHQSEELWTRACADAGSFYRRHTERDGDSATFNVIVGIISGLFCVFLVKGIFKRRPADTSERFEITEQDQPVFFAFIRRLCRDTGAPLPHRVYITPDVNAAVFRQESLLNLILPTRKNLVVGLGLVNRSI